VETSVVDLHRFEADPNFHFDADPDPDPVPERHQFEADSTKVFPCKKIVNIFPSHQYQPTLVYPSYLRLIGAIDTDPKTTGSGSACLDANPNLANYADPTQDTGEALS
jgi:hypothetical protein